ncbi:hypothetical protein D3C85_1170060 [compost metagenome]
MAAVVVGAQQRPDQQHRRAGGAHQAGQHGPEREDAGVQPGRAVQVATQADTAGHHVERPQQHDERDVFAQQRVHRVGHGGVDTELHRERHQEQRAPGRSHLAIVVVPEVRGQ